MNTKSKLTLLLLFNFSLLFSLGTNFKKIMDNVLLEDIKYQKKENRLKLLIANNTIEKSVNWFDINLTYRQHSNDITRDQIDLTETEYSDIEEEDTRCSIELNRCFFRKDMDKAYELINNRLDIIESQQELNLFRIETLSNIIDNNIKLFEAQKQIELINMEIGILHRENQILEELYAKNVITVTDLINNLENIEVLENSLSSWKEIIEEHRFQLTSHTSSFLKSFEQYILTTPLEIDTIKYIEQSEQYKQTYKEKIGKVLSAIKMNHFYCYLPEINTSVSYNERTTLQNWKIVENSLAEYLRERDFTEQYPEFEVELSLPFNVFGNVKGKYNLLKALEREAQIIQLEIESSYNQLEIIRLNSFIRSKNSYNASKRLSQLYSKQYELIDEKYRSHPTTLGNTPEITLKKEFIKNKKNELKLKLSEMELFRDIFLINYFIRD